MGSGRLLLLCTISFFLSSEYLWGQNTSILEKKIDSVVSNAIQQRAFPGCVVYAMRKGKPIFAKAYGYHTYDSMTATSLQSIYDLASVTKVTAATLALMKLYDDGLLDLDCPLGTYIPDLKGDIVKRKIRDLMTHQAGLTPGIPFHKDLQEAKHLDYTMKFDESQEPNTFEYTSYDYYPLIKEKIAQSKVKPVGQYRYSDLFFLLVPEIVKRQSGLSFERYLDMHFYEPLGAYSLKFNPQRWFRLSQIAPTEHDTVFRKRLVHGTVHDESAAMMLGVSGNAGLFANAPDLAKVWSMLLNDGCSDTLQLLSPHTLHLFTSVQNPKISHRALGFDKYPLQYDTLRTVIGQKASIRSFGHSGFTGTLVWADPDEDLLFIFLSNRVYPSREPNMLRDLRVRAVIHDFLYTY